MYNCVSLKLVEFKLIEYYLNKLKRLKTNIKERLMKCRYLYSALIETPKTKFF